MTANYSAKTPKGQATRARLIAAAAAEMVRANGDPEIAAIAARADLSEGALYRHFSSKGHLIAQVIADNFQAFQDEIYRPALDQEGSWPQRELIRTTRFVRFIYDNPIVRLALGPLGCDPVVAAKISEKTQQAVVGAAKNIRRGQAEGEIPRDIDADLTGGAVIGGLFQLIVTSLNKEKPDPIKKIDQQARAFVARTLALELARPGSD